MKLYHIESSYSGRLWFVTAKSKKDAIRKLLSHNIGAEEGSETLDVVKCAKGVVEVDSSIRVDKYHC